jgi:hypothetical protein
VQACPDPEPQVQVFVTSSSRPHILQTKISPFFISPQFIISFPPSDWIVKVPSFHFYQKMLHLSIQEIPYFFEKTVYIDSMDIFLPKRFCPRLSKGGCLAGIGENRLTPQGEKGEKRARWD